MEEILFTSDLHFDKDNPDQHRPGFDEEVFEENRRKYLQILRKHVKSESIDWVMLGGDIVSFGKRGQDDPEAPSEIRNFWDRTSEALDGQLVRMSDKSDKSIKSPFDFAQGDGVLVRCMPGNHDLGFTWPTDYPRVTPEIGMRKRALESFQENFSPLWYTFTDQTEKFKFISLCSSLMLFEPGEEQSEDNDYFRRLQQEQKDFYRREISSLRLDQRLLFLVHDPMAVPSLHEYLKEKKMLDRVERTFCGHFHSWFGTWSLPVWGWFLTPRMMNRLIKPIAISKLGDEPEWEMYRKCFFMGNRWNWRVWRQMCLTVIPAPNGSMGKFGGYLVATIDDGEFKVERRKI